MRIAEIDDAIGQRSMNASPDARHDYSTIRSEAGSILCEWKERRHAQSDRSGFGTSKRRRCKGGEDLEAGDRQDATEMD